MTKKLSDLMLEKAGLRLSQLLVEVEFGVPSRQCVNYGICRIEIARGQGRPKSSGCIGCGGLALASAPEDDLLQLAFFCSSLGERARRQHFGQGFFLVEEAYPLPRFLHNTLGLPAAAIGSGRYRVLEGKDVLIVRFFNLISL